MKALSTVRTIPLAGAILVVGCGLPAGELQITERQQDSLTIGSPRLGPACKDTLSCCPEEYLSCHGNPEEFVRCECRLWACDTTRSGAERCWKNLPKPLGMASAECSWTEFSYACEGAVGPEGLLEGDADWDCEINRELGTTRCEAAQPPNPLDTPEGTADYQCEPDPEFKLLVCTGLEPAPEPAEEDAKQTDCPFGLTDCISSNDAVSSVSKTGTPTKRSGGSGGGSAVGSGGTAQTLGSTDGAASPGAGLPNGSP
jgi:hypothetical protein